MKTPRPKSIEIQSGAMCNDLLDVRIADLIELNFAVKQVHWNLRWLNMMALHEFFDKLANWLNDDADTFVERVVQICGKAESKPQAVKDANA